MLIIKENNRVFLHARKGGEIDNFLSQQMSPIQLNPASGGSLASRTAFKPVKLNKLVFNVDIRLILDCSSASRTAFKLV